MTIKELFAAFEDAAKQPLVGAKAWKVERVDGAIADARACGTRTCKSPRTTHLPVPLRISP